MRSRLLSNWWIRIGLLLLSLGWVVSCQRSPQVTTSTAAECAVVQHVAGETCVPKSFERLVTLDDVMFEDAIAVGLAPFATVRSVFQKPLTPLITDAIDIGTSGEPSLEKILNLKPDLILGLDFHQGIYPQIAQIAPTLLVSFEHSGQWKDVFLQMAADLNQTPAANQVMAAYKARTVDFQTQMGDRLHNLQVSVVRIYPETINLYLRDSFVGTVLQDAGLARPASQDIGADEAAALFDNSIQTSISRELLEQADGDVIFLWTGENTTEAREIAQQKIEALQQDPLWQKLKAVQAGRVYTVPSYWIGSGPIAANAILDDLFNYLVEDS